MNEKITDLIYAARSLCEALGDKDILDYDEELREYLEETEAALDAVSDLEESDE